jgi:DNA-directed RNA polymerase subunit RPC12/RpoP
VIKFQCSACGRKFAAKDEDAGRRSKCPACGWGIVVPMESEWASNESPAVAPPPIADVLAQPLIARDVSASGRVQIDQKGDEQQLGDSDVAGSASRIRPVLLSAGIAMACIAFGLGGWVIGSRRSVESPRVDSKTDGPIVAPVPVPPPKPRIEPDYSRWTLDKTFRWGSENLLCVAFSPDGRTIAVGGGTHRSVETPSGNHVGLETGVVQLWDVVTREARGRFTEPEDEPRSLAFYPDGSSLAIGDRKKLKVVDVRSGILRFSVPESAWSVAINRRDGVLVTSHGGTFWDIANGEARPCFVRRTMTFPAFSPDGRFLYETGHLWSCETGKKIGDVPGGGAAAFSHDCALVGTRSGVCRVDGGIPIWQAPASYQVYSSIGGIAFSPDNKFMLISHLTDGELLILDSKSGKVVSRTRPHEGIFDFALSPDGQFMVTGAVQPTAELQRIKVWRVGLRRLGDNDERDEPHSN